MNIATDANDDDFKLKKLLQDLQKFGKEGLRKSLAEPVFENDNKSLHHFLESINKEDFLILYETFIAIGIHSAMKNVEREIEIDTEEHKDPGLLKYAGKLLEYPWKDFKRRLTEKYSDKFKFTDDEWKRLHQWFLDNFGK